MKLEDLRPPGAHRFGPVSRPALSMTPSGSCANWRPTPCCRLARRRVPRPRPGARPHPPPARQPNQTSPPRQPLHHPPPPRRPPPELLLPSPRVPPGSARVAADALARHQLADDGRTSATPASAGHRLPGGGMTTRLQAPVAVTPPLPTRRNAELLLLCFAAVITFAALLVVQANQDQGCPGT